MKNLVDSVKALDLNPVEEEAVVISPLKPLKLCSKIHKKPSLTNNKGLQKPLFITGKLSGSFGMITAGKQVTHCEQQIYARVTSLQSSLV